MLHYNKKKSGRFVFEQGFLLKNHLQILDVRASEDGIVVKII